MKYHKIYLKKLKKKKTCYAHRYKDGNNYKRSSILRKKWIKKLEK